MESTSPPISGFNFWTPLSSGTASRINNDLRNNEVHLRWPHRRGVARSFSRGAQLLSGSTSRLAACRVASALSSRHSPRRRLLLRASKKLEFIGHKESAWEARHRRKLRQDRCLSRLRATPRTSHRAAEIFWQRLENLQGSMSGRAGARRWEKTGEFESIMAIKDHATSRPSANLK